MSSWAVYLFLLFGSITAECPPGSKYDSYFNKCYQFFPSPLPFLSAEQRCNSIGGHLADIQNVFENFYVAGEGGASNFWIGANLLLSSNWTWSSNSPMVFTNWANGQPVDSNACAYVKDSDHTWGALPCNTKFPFMCTISPNAAQPETCPTQPPSPTCGPDACPYDSYCTDGYTLYTRNCMCYKYFNDTFPPFSYANASCAKDGGMLAKIPSKDVNDFLMVLPGFNCFSKWCPWIGLYCNTSTEDSCFWVDGTPLGNYRNFFHFGSLSRVTTYYLGTFVSQELTINYGPGRWMEDTYDRAFLCQKASTRANLTSSSLSSSSETDRVVMS